MWVAWCKGQKITFYTGAPNRQGSLLQKRNDSEKGHEPRKLVQVREVNWSSGMHNLQNEVLLVREALCNLTQRMICIVWSLDVTWNKPHGSLKTTKKNHCNQLNDWLHKFLSFYSNIGKCAVMVMLSDAPIFIFPSLIQMNYEPNGRFWYQFPFLAFIHLFIKR